MKAVVILASLIGAVVCYPWGIPQQVHDTPEVAAAKSAHLAAHAQARYSSPSWGAQERSWKGHEDDGSWKDDGDDGSWKGEGNTGSWSGAAAGASHEDDGSWKEDGSSKHYDDGSWKDDIHSWNQGSSGAHSEGQSWNQGSTGAHSGGQSWNHGSSGSHWEGHEKKWTGPIALPPGYDKHGAPLPVQDTPEVAAAKSKHFHLYHHAAAHAAPAHTSHYHH